MSNYGEGPLELDPSVIAEMEAEEQQKQDQLAALPAEMQAQAGNKSVVSKLDPRGFMFVSQIGPSTPMPGESKPAAPTFGAPPQGVLLTVSKTPTRQRVTRRRARKTWPRSRIRWPCRPR